MVWSPGRFAEVVKWSKRWHSKCSAHSTDVPVTNVDFTGFCRYTIVTKFGCSLLQFSPFSEGTYCLQRYSSGPRGGTRNAIGRSPVRGFESHPLRDFPGFREVFFCQKPYLGCNQRILTPYPLISYPAHELMGGILDEYKRK